MELLQKLGVKFLPWKHFQEFSNWIHVSTTETWRNREACFHERIFLQELQNFTHILHHHSIFYRISGTVGIIPLNELLKVPRNDRRLSIAGTFTGTFGDFLASFHLIKDLVETVEVKSNFRHRNCRFPPERKKRSLQL